jgi:hypothetical protein
MRDLLSKVISGTMVAGAALLVTACGGGEDAAANNTANYATDEALMGNDVTAVDAMNGTDANLGMGVDANLGATDLNAGATMNATDAGTNTAGTGNTTGM